jgi:serine/threonine protein kinase/tetratricopeptide (TPR) repeat protein
VQGKAQDDDLIMNLVELTLAVPAEEREAYLQKTCGHDPELFRLVWEYVQGQLRMNGFLLDPLGSSESEEQNFKPGDVLDGRFRILREVAQGGMGIVYEAWDEKLERRIALKCAKPGFQKRLPPEVRNASEISHPNVCKIFEIHTASMDEGDVDFITMEFLEGETLSDRLRRGISKEEAQSIALQICAGLSEAHRNRLIHGDLKSNNIYLTTGTDGKIRAVITDFGLARKPEVSMGNLQSGVVAGTPSYMAPELFAGQKASLASDVYALGVILNELILGQFPRGPDVTELDWSQSRHVQKRPPGVNRKWDKVIARCLDPDPARRFRDAGEVTRALTPSVPRRLFFTTAAVILLAIVSNVVTYQNTQTPPKVVRLAVLPFEADAATKPLAEGLLLDTGNRLSHVKPGSGKLTLVPLGDSLQNNVDQPAQARTMLGATHSLSGKLKRENGHIVVSAYLTDTQSLVQLNEWRAEYGEGELQNMPVALAGMVTGTLKLAPLVQQPTVNAAAYPDFVTGVSLARRDSDLDKALPFLEAAVKADPNSPLTFASLADAQFSKYFVTKDLSWKDRAWQSLKRAEQINPDIAAVRFVSGTINEDDGKYEQALADFERAIELEPANADAWRRLGRTYEHDSQPTQALASYLKAVELQPDYFRNYQDLGQFYINSGDYLTAVTQYKKVVQLAPDLAQAHYMLATPYLNMGRYTEAETELRTAISLRETVNEVEALGLVRMNQSREREAIPYLQRSLEIGGRTSLLYLNLGTAFRRAGFPREANDAYRKGMDLSEARLAANPRDAYEKVCLAYLCARLGEARRAQAEVAQAMQLSRGANNVRWMAALTYEALGQHDNTMAVIEDAPDSLLSRLNRSPEVADLHRVPRFKQLIEARHIQ